MLSNTSCIPVDPEIFQVLYHVRLHMQVHNLRLWHGKVETEAQSLTDISDIKECQIGLDTERKL